MAAQDCVHRWILGSPRYEGPSLPLAVEVTPMRCRLCDETRENRLEVPPLFDRGEKTGFAGILASFGGRR